VRRAPAHAGRLRAWERLAFALVFALMAVFVVAVTMSAAGSAKARLASQAHPPASIATGHVRPVQVGPGTAEPDSSGAQSGTGVTAAALDRLLATAMRPVIRHDAGHIAVGVVDVSTGARAVYDGRRHFAAGSIEKADILASLLLDHQRAGTPLTTQEAALAGPMIENSDDDDAAADLWSLAGGHAGVAAASITLGLSHTILGPSLAWGLTRTTVTDQLRLLADLTASSSPLSAASRDYELGLMDNVQESQNWGVSAAASPGTGYAIKDAWLPDPDLWVINSIGVVDYDGQQLLIAALSDDQPTQADGIAAVSAAAATAAKVITRTP
jgi:hypothetical protein